MQKDQITVWSEKRDEEKLKKRIFRTSLYMVIQTAFLNGIGYFLYQQNNYSIYYSVFLILIVLLLSQNPNNK